MLLSGIVSVLLGALDGVRASPSRSAAALQDLSRVDIHAHFVPPFWRELTTENGYGQPDGMPAIPVSWANVSPLNEIG